MITLRQLRYFIAAVETGKMSTAASACGVSQSAVTNALKELEDQLGCRLFVRRQSGVSLTPDGHLFLAKARDIMASVAEATNFRQVTEADSSGELTIGVTYTVMGYFIGPHAIRFQRRFSATKLRLVQLERPALEEAIAEGTIDFAVMLISNVRRRRGISVQLIQSSPRRLWLPPGHPLLEQKTIRLKDVAAHPYIMLTVDEAEQTALRYWRKAGLSPSVTLSTSSVEAVRSFVAGGLGVSILSDMVYRPWSLEGQRIELRSIEDAVPPMDIGVAWRTKRSWRPAELEFIHLLEALSTRSSTP